MNAERWSTIKNDKIFRIAVLLLLALILVSPAASFGSLLEDVTGSFNLIFDSSAAEGTETTGSSSYSVLDQSEFNAGKFNGTSADRKDNSGNLGLGYLNGSGAPQTGLNDDTLVGHWRLDKDTGDVIDYSGEGNDGDASGTNAERGVNGVFGTSAFNFDGSDDAVIVPNDESLDLSGSITLSAWVYPTSGGQQYSSYILSRSTGGSAGVYMIAYDDDDDVEFCLFLDGSENCLDGQATLPLNEWTLITATYQDDGSDMKIYLNAEQDASMSASGSLDVNDQEIGIGAHTDSPNNRRFVGHVDEPRIYNRSLSENEIDRLYFNGMDGTFQGNYTSKKIDTSSNQSWNNLYIDSTVPTNTNTSAVFRALDSGGTVVDKQIIDLGTDAVNHSLNVQDSEDAEVFFNGTTTDEAESWEISEFKVYYGDSGSTSTSSDSISNQSEYNKGNFNGTSADRNDNSGNLGIGYLNGSQAGQPETNPLNNESLIGYWRLDRDSGSSGSAIDYSGKTNDGSNNAVSTAKDGIFGSKGYGFDGTSSYVEVTDSSDFDWGSSLSVSGWVYVRDWSSDGTAFAKKNGGQSEPLLWADSGNTNFAWGVNTGNGFCKIDSTGKTRSSGKWYHIAGNYNGSEIKLYVNGTEIATDSNSCGGPVVTSSSNAYLGQAAGGSKRLDGRIDELRVYNRPLSDSEIQKLYFHGKDGTFNGNYTSDKIDTDSTQSWDQLYVDSTVPDQTSANATLKALGSSGNVVDSQLINLNTEAVNHSLSVTDSEDAKVVFNGTSTNTTKTWEVSEFTVFYSEIGGGKTSSLTWSKFG